MAAIPLLQRSGTQKAQPDGWAGDDELERICQAVEIDSPTSFSFAERKFEVPARALSGAVPNQPNAALARLEQVLYEYCYTRRFRGQPVLAPAPASAPDPGFVRQLVAANHGGERMDSGWRIMHIEPSGRVTAAKHGVYRTFPPGKYFSPYGSGGPVWQNMTIGVYLAKGSLSLQPGFYFAYGENLGEAQDPQDVLRIYWNVRAAGVFRLLAALTQRLNRFQVPFNFKTLTQPAYYQHRSDGSVLYFHRRFFSIVARLYVELASTLADEFESDTPLFTKPLGLGVGLAEDPGTGSSFGLSRCRILAEALWIAHGRDIRTADGRLAEVEAHFIRHGLSLARPYLNSRSTDRYHLPSREDGP